MVARSRALSSPSQVISARAVLQVIYLFANITTNDDVSTEYSEPAKSINNMLAVFSLEFMNFAPPECVDPDATFYTKLVIMTSAPLFVPLLILLNFR